MFDAIETFITARAVEALHAVIWMGPSKTAWFIFGAAFPTLLLGFGRISQMLPGEEAWPLSTIRGAGSLAAWGVLFASLTTLAYMLRNQTAFWPFVGKYAAWSGFGFLAGIFTGSAARILIARYLEPVIADFLHHYTKDTANQALFDERLTDVRTVSDQLPTLDGKRIDHATFFALAKQLDAVFLGIDADDQAVMVPRQVWKKSHVQICGPTGSGKGVQAGGTLCQGIDYGDAVYVIDPKRDEWAASVLAQQCERAGRPFLYVDSREDVPQINLTKGISQEDLFELFVAAFGLAEKGEAADFYRIDDRKAAYQLSHAASEGDFCLSELFDRAPEYIDASLMQSAKGFLSRLEEVARVPAFQTREGVDLAAPLREGGVLYFVGAMRGQSLPALQKMVVLRIIQLVENQQTSQRHTSIFLDEIKYLLAEPIINAFGTIRDKSANLLLAHQALQDLRDCGKDLNADAVEAAIKTNTQLKWIYRCADPDTAEWSARLSGKIIIDKDRRMVARNEGLSETMDSTRQLDQAERYFVDENKMLQLPNGCALFIGDGVAKLALTQPVQTEKRSFTVTPASGVERIEPGQTLIDNPQPDPPKPGDDLI